MTDQPVGDLQPTSSVDSSLAGKLADSASSLLSCDEIDRVLLGLQRQVHNVHVDNSEPVATATRLSKIERELLDLSGKLEQVDAGNVGGSVIADVEDWANLCEELNLDDAVEAARKSIRDFSQNSARVWEEGVEAELTQPTMEICFRRLLETTARRCEAARSAERVLDDALFAAVAEAIRQTFQRCLKDESPTTESRQRWTTDLSDYVDLALTAIDDSPPEQAADELRLIEGNLQWHLKHVEKSFGRPRRRLRRKLARVRAEMQERQLQHRLERRFGTRLVAFSERLVLLLICLVVALITIQAAMDLSPRTILWFNVIDSCACFVFLCEFFTKLWMVQGRARWFRRHFLIDLIPSIPIGLIFIGLSPASKADTVRLGRLARFFRLARLTRYVRVLRPLLRVLRGLGLMARGLDRLARRYGHLLNQNVILYPTRAELERAEKSTRLSEAVDLEHLRGRLRDHWQQLLSGTSETQRCRVAAVRQELFRTAFDRALRRETIATAAPRTRLREIPAGTLIAKLESSTQQHVREDLGDELVGHLARVTRIFARRPLRWFPIVRRCVPIINEDMTNADVTAAAARRIARVIKGYYNAWFWVADLYGTVTPSQFVGRVGTTLVNRSSRPAYRLVLFGGIFLLTELILSLTALSILRPLRAFLRKFVGTTILVIGSVCFFFLGVGFWLKRVAREATEFYEQSVQAQFLSLTEVIRTRYLKRDVEILYDRVLRPGCLLQDEKALNRRDEHLKYVLDRVRQSLFEAHIGGDDSEIDGLKNTVLLYRDWLDGAILTDNDTRSTRQLLGNPAIRQALRFSGRVDGKQVKALKRLDLVRQKSLLGGPYLWFNFISRSIAHSVAMLLVDYNKNAIPLGELPRISPTDRKHYDRWLSGEEGRPVTSETETEGVQQKFITTSFTALHFLDFDEQRDRELENRFGREVLLRLQMDRSLMIRRIFGTYPMHDRPKEQRVVNLFSLYNSWLAGGRAFLIPWFVLCLVCRLIWSFFAWIIRSVKEIRRPDFQASSRNASKAHFFVAVRKIERIRGPVVDASLRLRIKLDPEYLGVPLPGRHVSTLGPADVDADLRFLNSDPAIRQVVDEERQRAQDDMKRLQVLIDGGLLQRIACNAGLPAESFNTPEHVRAAAVAYLGDYCEVRRHLSTRALLDELLQSANDLPLPARSWPRPLLKRKFRRFWRKHGTGGRCAAWRAIQQNMRGVADALCAWHRLGEGTTAVGEKLLGEILLHPGCINEQLLAVRAVQTLAVLDVLNYRQHIYHLGRYADMGDKRGRLLEWNTVLGFSSVAQPHSTSYEAS